MSSAKEKTTRKLPKKITPDYLHNSGLYYLQRFSASSAQFRSVMARKVKKSCLVRPEQDYESCMQMVDELVAKFQRSGLLNDDLYAQGAVSSLRRQGKSQKAISMKLKTKGLADNLISKKLLSHAEESGHDTHHAELISAILHMRKKKIGPFAGKKEITEDKILASLSRAGFSYDTIRKILDMDQEHAEEILRS